LDDKMIDSAVITPRIVKTKQAAHYLGVSAWKLRNLVQAGELACIIGDGTSPWLFDIRDLDDWIERQKRTL
jgi:excisionase family DNA binding protein